MTLDINLLREIVTVASFLSFAGIVWYVAAPSNRGHFEAAARLPLDDE